MSRRPLGTLRPCVTTRVPSPSSLPGLRSVCSVSWIHLAPTRPHRRGFSGSQGDFYEKQDAGCLVQNVMQDPECFNAASYENMYGYIHTMCKIALKTWAAQLNWFHLLKASIDVNSEEVTLIHVNTRLLSLLWCSFFTTWEPFIVKPAVDRQTYKFTLLVKEQHNNVTSNKEKLIYWYSFYVQQILWTVCLLSEETHLLHFEP